MIKLLAVTVAFLFSNMQINTTAVEPAPQTKPVAKSIYDFKVEGLKEEQLISQNSRAKKSSS